MDYEVERSVQVLAADLRCCSDGVLEIRLHKGSRLDEQSMGELLAAQFELTPVVSGLLIDARQLLSMSKRAHEMAANNPVNDRTAAAAILVKSPVSTLLGNFFVRFARPPYPTRVFRDEQQARSWLHAKLKREADV